MSETRRSPSPEWTVVRVSDLKRKCPTRYRPRKRRKIQQSHRKEEFREDMGPKRFILDDFGPEGRYGHENFPVVLLRTPIEQRHAEDVIIPSGGPWPQLVYRKSWPPFKDDSSEEDLFFATPRSSGRSSGQSPWRVSPRRENDILYSPRSPEYDPEARDGFSPLPDDGSETPLNFSPLSPDYVAPQERLNLFGVSPTYSPWSPEYDPTSPPYNYMSPEVANWSPTNASEVEDPLDANYAEIYVGTPNSSNEGSEPFGEEEASSDSSPFRYSPTRSKSPPTPVDSEDDTGNSQNLGENQEKTEDRDDLSPSYSPLGSPATPRSPEYSPLAGDNEEADPLAVFENMRNPSDRSPSYSPIQGMHDRSPSYSPIGSAADDDNENLMPQEHQEEQSNILQALRDLANYVS